MVIKLNCNLNASVRKFNQFPGDRAEFLDLSQSAFKPLFCLITLSSISVSVRTFFFLT